MLTAKGDELPYLWVPNFHLQGTVLNLLQEYRLWPCPLVHDSEELPDDDRTGCLGV